MWTIFFIFMSTLTSQAQVVFDAHTEVELVSENTSIRPGESFWVALRMKTDDHWHTYWRNPGDSGLATKITWQLPEGFLSSAIHWPYPKRIYVSGLTSYGYADEVFLLTEITPPANLSDSSITLQARADWLACEVPCIPGKAELFLTLSILKTPPAKNPRWEKDFIRTRAKLPIQPADYTIEAAADDAVIRLLFIPTGPLEKITNIEFFPFADNIVAHSALQKLESTAQGYSLTLQRDIRTRPKNFKILSGVAVAHLSGAASVKVWEVEVNHAPLSWWPMLGFAFLGGMILNLMPCVFPVLSIKALTFINHAKNKRALRKSAAGYTAGIVISFIILALLLLFLRQAGEKIGWGFQFQSPYFVTGISLFLFIMALNLFGLFEWNLPLSLSMTRSKNTTLSESFLSGILAVIVATPCTAPFMGTAISFALTQNTLVSLFIFISLGLGMAFPFIVLCWSPGLLRIFPKPGIWMEHFKKFLGFPLLATVLWLLWVLAGQKGMQAVFILLAGFWLITFGFWIKNISAQQNTLRTALKILGWTSLVVGIFLPLRFVGSAAASAQKIFSEQTVQGIPWVLYDEAILAQAKQEKKIIFYDFTARWCLTCQVNERLVLNHPAVISKFKELDIVAVKADWTNRDEKISKALAEFGKSSVPVYVIIYFINGQEQKEILPEILTPKIVLELLEKINRYTKGD